MKIITQYHDDVKHDTINCVPLFPLLNLWCEFEAHLTTKSFRSRDQSVRSRCSSHSAAQSHVAYSVQCHHTGDIYNKATRSPEISSQQAQKLTPQFLFYIYWI